MKMTKLVLGLVVPALATRAIQAKFRAECVANTPGVATLVKLAYKPVLRWAANQILLGRYLDRNEPEKGRFTRSDVEAILEQTWRNYDELAPGAGEEQLKTLGNRQNVLLGVATLALYRALLSRGLDQEYATELLADVAWKGYETWIRLPRLIARIATPDPQKQMDMMLRMFLRFPFNRPGYDSLVLPQPGVFAVNFYRCPIYDYFKAQGEVEVFRNSWCNMDFALAQVMTQGGYYERPHTLSAGDNVCAMRWYGVSQKAGGAPGNGVPAGG